MRYSSRRTTAVTIAIIALAAALVVSPVAGAAGSASPRTWHVLVGGHTKGEAVQAEGYYPHVITIDVGDTVVWTLNTGEAGHSVTFAGTCEDVSCVPPCVGSIDISPCGSPSYDGVSALDSSGRMVPSGYNWDYSFTPGGTTFSLTFTQPGINVYFDLSYSGMRGVVVVQPAGTPYPFSQAQYSAQAQEQLTADLAAGLRAWPDSTRATNNHDGTRTYRVAVGASSTARARVTIAPAAGSAVHGRALLEEPGAGSSPTPAITVRLELTGLAPGSVHAAQILPGVCGAPAPITGLLPDILFVPPTFTLDNLRAGPDGEATSTTVLTAPPNFNGPGQLRIPSSGWFVNVAAGSTPDNAATSDACGDIVFHAATVMRYFPQALHVHVGDTVVWSNDTSEVHGVTFLAGQPLPLIPDWFFGTPTGNGTRYDGSTAADSGPLYAADAGREHDFSLTFTRAGSFPYVDVGDFALGMRGRVIVAR
jgi:plastocyanin